MRWCECVPICSALSADGGGSGGVGGGVGGTSAADAQLQQFAEPVRGQIAAHASAHQWPKACAVQVERGIDAASREQRQHKRARAHTQWQTGMLVLAIGKHNI